jgi:hypothetical protein
VPETIPGAALALGLGGLLPFLGAATMAVAGLEWHGLTGPDLARGYGAVILAFLGGAQWGSTLPHREDAWVRYGYSVLPALLAWAALLVDLRTGLGTLIGGFAFVYVVDEWMRARRWLPAWYLRLRRRLTAVVLACVAVSLWGVGPAG